MKSILILLAAVLAPGQPSASPTGPAVGARVPNFQAVDQNGRVQTLQTLSGPNGLVLQFVRSADW